MNADLKEEKAKTPLRLALVAPGIFPLQIGGIQRHSRHLAEGLAAMPGIELTLIHGHGKQKVFPEPLKIREIGLNPPNPKIPYLAGLWFFSARVLEVLKRENFDCVYAQGISVWKGFRSIKMPVIVNPHGLEAFQAVPKSAWRKLAPFRHIQSRMFRNADRVASEGGKLTEILEKIIPARQILHLPNAVHPAPKPVFRAPQIGERKRLLFLGRLAANKGLHVLLKALRQLPDESRPEVTIAGDGPMANELRRANLPAQVRLTGFVDDGALGELFAQHHGLVLPTLYEGMPTVLLEAMTHGLPVISSDVGAVRDLINAENGWLLPAGDAKSLADAIKEFSGADPAILQEMGRIGRLKAENFSWERLVQAHLVAIRELVFG